MRVLQVIWDGGGNVPPQLAIARRLVEGGHEVRILGHACQRERAERTGAEFTAYRYAPDTDASSPEKDLLRDWEAKTPIGAFARVRDRLMYGPSLLFARDVLAELKAHPADVVAWDYLLQGAGIGVEKADLPSVTLIHTVYPLPAKGLPPFGQGLMPAKGPFGRVRDAAMSRGFRLSFAPGLRALNGARRELGLDPLDDPFEQVRRVDAALVLTSPAFDFAGEASLPETVHFTGPVLEPASDGGWESPWPAKDERPLVLASFSTTFQDQNELAARVVEALGSLPVRGLVTTGPAIDLTGVTIPENVEVRDFVPHAAVLPDASLTVSHAGLGTVHAALAAGVPLVCIPHGRDQEDNAARVVAAEAGIRLRKGVSAEKLAKEIEGALADPKLKEGAVRLAKDFGGRDGAAAAVAEIEALGAAG